VQKILQKSSLSILTETVISHIFPDFLFLLKNMQLTTCMIYCILYITALVTTQ